MREKLHYTDILLERLVDGSYRSLHYVSGDMKSIEYIFSLVGAVQKKVRRIYALDFRSGIAAKHSIR